MKKAKLILIAAVVIGAVLGGRRVFTHPGKALFYDPGFAGSQNQDSCASCHAGGHQIGNLSTKKSFLIVETRYTSVEEVINKVMIPKYLLGRPIGKESKEMKDLVDYLIQLKTDSI